MLTLMKTDIIAITVNFSSFSNKIQHILIYKVVN
jgi:hypothetical protein